MRLSEEEKYQLAERYKMEKQHPLSVFSPESPKAHFTPEQISTRPAKAMPDIPSFSYFYPNRSVSLGLCSDINKLCLLQ